ncbi:MAG: 16S rRNA (guanine(966)-N(2))-methyltransferase RsmD [Pseudomonadota bacterium]
MRIVGGTLKGLALTSPGRGDTAAQLRPTADRVRESLFNILANQGLPEGARVLDLFAGTGALGLEALSRGAVHATFVDSGAKAQSLLRANIAKARMGSAAELLQGDATRLPRAKVPADLVFLDPPYGKGLGQKALEAARSSGWIADGATLVLEEASAQPIPEGFELLEMRRYGAAQLHFLEAHDAA